MNPIPVFSVAKRKTNGDHQCQAPRTWLEEHVTLFFPHYAYERPVFRVTDEHRKRWPKEYAAFRAGQSWLVKLQLWFRARYERRFMAIGPDQRFDASFREWATEVYMGHVADHDDSLKAIRASLEAALGQSEG